MSVNINVTQLCPNNIRKQKVKTKLNPNKYTWISTKYILIDIETAMLMLNLLIRKANSRTALSVCPFIEGIDLRGSHGLSTQWA